MNMNVKIKEPNGHMGWSTVEEINYHNNTFSFLLIVSFSIKKIFSPIHHFNFAEKFVQAVYLDILNIKILKLNLFLCIYHRKKDQIEQKKVNKQSNSIWKTILEKLQNMSDYAKFMSINKEKNVLSDNKKSDEKEILCNVSLWESKWKILFYRYKTKSIKFKMKNKRKYTKMKFKFDGNDI
ncbi:hypothetical protein RFI_04830 [Reticulomyxa filosa]|uniref:Uncharacterized protein n=1 Tax=Reticulomyxa filosa TaxID=46433 RepID=X6P142_RETFI|nr:hypothetical protein RFI_04830 [Reticulomyxa filosa]|eukprot:ETO32285.1 hypothetical protein RFI_04830 [Reticulomyxa filosa]